MFGDPEPLPRKEQREPRDIRLLQETANNNMRTLQGEQDESGEGAGTEKRYIIQRVLQQVPFLQEKSE